MAAKGNETLLAWLNEEIESLGEENFFHADYEETLADTYGLEYEETLVVEGGQPAAAEAESEEGSEEESEAAETEAAAEAETEAVTE